MALRLLFDDEEKKENSAKYKITKSSRKINKNKSALKDFVDKINIVKVESFFESGKYKESVALIGLAQKKPEEKK